MPPPGLLLEGMQDVDGGLETDGVNGPVRVAVAVSELDAVDRKPHAVLHRVWEAFHIRFAGPTNSTDLNISSSTPHYRDSP